MSTTVLYSLLRILLFLASLLVLWAVGVRDPLWLLLSAATVSMLISVFALHGLRDRMSQEVVARVERRRNRTTSRRGPATDEAAEDAEIRPHAQDPDAFR